MTPLLITRPAVTARDTEVTASPPLPPLRTRPAEMGKALVLIVFFFLYSLYQGRAHVTKTRTSLPVRKPDRRQWACLTCWIDPGHSPVSWMLTGEPNPTGCHALRCKSLLPYTGKHGHA